MQTVLAQPESAAAFAALHRPGVAPADYGRWVRSLIRREVTSEADREAYWQIVKLYFRADVCAGTLDLLREYAPAQCRLVAQAVLFYAARVRSLGRSNQEFGPRRMPDGMWMVRNGRIHIYPTEDECWAALAGEK
jgi:hypothetical protein